MRPRAEAFLRQARADFAAFRHLLVSDAPEVADCHRLLMLQMAIEKLAKAVLYARDDEAEVGHAAAMLLPAELQTRRAARILGYASTRSLIRAVSRARPTLAEIARLHPSVTPGGDAADRPESVRHVNVEYPWFARDGRGLRWTAPADQGFPLTLRLTRRGDGHQTLRLLEQVLERAEELVPPG